ncbi:hypothetical protein Tco_1253165 [Tanacetum coccineum]
MTETMEQHMSKTRGNYGSGVARPKIDDKTHFELKGQFLKELRKNTFSSSKHEDSNEHIEKVLEIVDLFCIPEFLNKYCPPTRTAKKMEEINNFQQEPDERPFLSLERFKELLMKCLQHYLTDMQEVILFYNVLDVPTRQILDLKDEQSPTRKRIQKPAQLNEDEPRDHVKSILTAKADPTEIRRIGPGPYAISDSQYSNIFSETVPFSRRLHGYCCDVWKEEREIKILETYDHTLPQKEKDLGSFTLPCFIYNICFDKALVDLGASVSVMPSLPTSTLV